MPFRSRYISYFLFWSFIFSNCNDINGPEVLSEVEKKNVRFLYYDSAFSLDSISKINLSGYYRIREVFGISFKPSYGFLQFFDDGFCKVGHWNGIYKTEAELDAAFDNSPASVFWGIYKIDNDTLQVEYLYNPASPGRGPTEDRFTLTGIIKENEIIILKTESQKYSYPDNPRDSIVNSCIGKFVLRQSLYMPEDNYLKTNIKKYQ